MTPELKGFILVSTVKLVGVFGSWMLGVAFITWVERRVAGWMQNRLGPNRVGPQGLFQPIADGIKSFVKEEALPGEADRALFLMAPAMSFIPSLVLFAVVPLAAPLPLAFDWTVPLLGRFVYEGPMPVIVADLPVGVLFILAVSSLAVYGLVLAGWSAGNKYSLLGGLRSSAQMISYEIALGLSFISVFILAGNVTLPDVVAAQQASVWFVLQLLLGCVMFWIAGLAENNRLPFDLPEAESELVAGYHAEYSSMRFALFMLAEYGALITMSALIATLFFGGWDVPFTSWDEGEPSWLRSFVTAGAFGLKTFAIIFVAIWVRWTLPRFRFDQLMALGWKVMLPMALVYIMVTATLVWALDAAGMAPGLGYGLVLFAANVVLVVIVFFLVDRDRLVMGQQVDRRVDRRVDERLGRA